MGILKLNDISYSGSGSAKQTPLTQAEYDTLVQAGTVDPTMEYFITDGIPSSVEYYHNYSTNEQIVGTWIDGSTLYEKTVNVTSITVGADIRVNHGISNFGTLVGLEGHIKYSSEWLPLPYFSLTTSYQIMVGNVNATNFLYRIGDSFNVNDLSNFYVTIRYTKSSS